MKLPGKWYDVLKCSWINFFRDGCSNHSAAISYYALLSIFPFFLLVFTVLDRILGIEGIPLEKAIDFIRGFFPELPAESIYHLKDLVNRGDGYFMTLIGLVVMFWMTHLVFSALEYAINSIFKTHSFGTLWKGKLKTFLLTLILAFFLGVFFIFNNILAFLHSISPGITRGMTHFFIRSFALKYILPVIIAYGFFLYLYRTLPHTRVRWRYVFIGSTFSTLLWETAKYVFTLYISIVPTYGVIFGSMATIVIFLIWIYLSSCIVLFGAEIIALLNGNRSLPEHGSGY